MPKQLPKRYFGLHMAEGVAEYLDRNVNDGEPYRILVLENALKEMDQTFTGRPVYVRHVNDVDMDNLQNEADGYVVKSFFNKADGKHWVEFLVVSDKGHEAISKKWKLSNCYSIKNHAGGGLWHNVEYAKEVRQGEYEHLAIVDDPRYAESIILTPEEFKTYNSQKEFELDRLANSKQQGESHMAKLNFFKRSKVENSADLESTSVTLKSGKDMTIAQIINAYDEAEEKKANEEKSGEKPMCNGEHMVNVGDEKMSVNALVEKHLAMVKEKNESQGEHEASESESEESSEHQNEDDTDEALEKKKKEENEASEEEKKKDEEKKANAKDNFDKLANARREAEKAEDSFVDTSTDQLARGKSRYGSK